MVDVNNNLCVMRSDKGKLPSYSTYVDKGISHSTSLPIGSGTDRAVKDILGNFVIVSKDFENPSKSSSLSFQFLDVFSGNSFTLPGDIFTADASSIVKSLLGSFAEQVEKAPSSFTSLYEFQGLLKVAYLLHTLNLVRQTSNISPRNLNGKEST